MSPAAVGGSHIRTASVNGAGPVSTENGNRSGTGTGTGTGNGLKSNGLDGARGGTRVFPHLDDLVSVKPDININQPMRTILQTGELLAKAADTHLDFRRPDIALQEYIKAYIVTVEIIPRHKDYPSLQSDRGELHRLYLGLTKRINSQHAKFGEVKELIKENNSISHVTPTIRKAVSELGVGETHKVARKGHTRTQSTKASVISSHPNGSQHPEQDTLQNGPDGANMPSNGAQPRKRPVIQPKPEALHGKAIHPPVSNTKTDLAARFARLRSFDSNTSTQDPRIRTQTISITDSSDSSKEQPNPSPTRNSATIVRLSAPRSMPSVPKTIPRPTKIPLDTHIPGMPRAPDAIYSPSRNTDTSATTNLPSSIPRGASYLGNGRTTSAPPISTVGPTPATIEPQQDYFAPIHSVNGSAPQPKKRQDVFIPDSVYVSAEDLYRFQGLGSDRLRILLVDLRSREKFNSGHIMSQSVICVEPIGLKQGMSGDDLADSMIVAPDSEQALFEKRNEFDIIVFYDQSSSIVHPFSPTGDDASNSLRTFAAAVYDFGYEKRSRRRPMLLVGGLDSWVDLMGANSLEVTSDGTQKPARIVGLARDSGRADAARRRTESRPLTKEEERKWDEALREDQVIGRPANADRSTSDELFIVRSTDDFFRRYPDVSTIQESMVSMAPLPPPLSTHISSLADTVPTPPTRPAPALPRQRSSGISERGPAAVYAPIHSVTTSAITDARVIPGLTGLHNPGVLCYMNVCIQAISASTFLRELLRNFQYPPTTVVPKKENEKSEPPQLMVRNLGNVLRHLWTGQYDWITPKTFAEYVNAVHAGRAITQAERVTAFGGNNKQHDAPEFLTFLTEVLEDELNIKRNVKPRNLTTSEEAASNALPVMMAAQEAWARLGESENSPITSYMRGQAVQLIRCNLCGAESRVFTPFNQLDIPVSWAGGKETLREAVSKMYGPKSSEKVESSCDKCGVKVARKTQETYFSYLPDYLVVHLKRYDNLGAKVNTLITFPESKVDMTSSFIPESEHRGSLERGQAGPFLYDCYGVIQHQGATVQGGHFWAITRALDKGIDGGKGAGAWHKFNDSRVSPASFKDTQNSLTYTILLRREGSTA